MPSTKELVFRILGDTEDFNKAISQTTQQLDDFKKQTNEANALFGKVAKQSAVATTAIAAMGIASAKMAQDFNAGFSKVQTLIPGAKDRIKELQDDILNLSPTVGKATDDLTDGVYQVISAFGDTSETTENLALAAKAATAGNAKTTDSINLLSAVTKGYGDTSNRSQKKVADLAFTAVKLGQTDFPQLASSIQNVTAMSAELGVTQEEMFAVFSSGTGVIGGAAEVSTKLKAVYVELQKPQKRLTEAFEELQVSSGSELIEKFGGLSGAMQALKGVAEKTGEPISNLFGSAEAGNLALYAAGKGAKKFASDLKEMQTALGATDQAFDDATVNGPDAFGFQLKQAGLNAKIFSIKVGQELIPSIQALLTPLFKGLAALKDLDEQTIKMIVSVGKVILTITATTTAVMGYKKAVTAVKAAQIALNGAFAANPFGAFVVGATAAIVALKELCNLLDSAHEKQMRNKLSNLEESTANMVKAQQIGEIAKQYGILVDKEKLSNKEKVKLLELAKQLEEITLTAVKTDKSGRAVNQKGLFFAGAKDVAKKKKKDLEKYKKHLLELQKFEKEVSKQVKEYGESSAWSFEEALEKFAIVPKSMKTVTAAKDAQAKVRHEIELLKKNITETTRAVAAIDDLSRDSFDFKEEKKEDSNLKNGDGTKEEEVKNTQADRLSKLDATFKLEKKLLEKQNLSEKELNDAKEKVEAEHYKKRLDLLKKFHEENVTEKLKENGSKSISLEESLTKAVGEKNENILQETKKTNEELSRLANERYNKELEKLKSTSEEAKKEIDSEIALKKEMGEIEGKDDKEKNRTAKLLEAQKLHEKRNDIMQEYLRLQNSSNEKDKEKAKILLQELDELGNLEKRALDAAGNVEKTFIEKAENFLAKVQKWGGEIANAFSNVANLAKDIIGAKEAKRKQETAQKIAEIERNKSETLLEIDDELAEMREEKQLETAEREAERREEEYQKRIADYNRNILSLEGKLQTETNLEKLRNIEQQLEETRKKKAEEVQRKKEEKEKEKREKEARKQEVELLNARAKAEHDFAVTKIETENIAGVASAKAAQEAAKWQKAQTSMSLSLKAIEQGVLAAIAFAKGAAGNPLGFVEGAARTAAATMAGVQIGVVAAQPLPPDYTAQPLPPAPKPIKFAEGGIIMPRNGGTGITLPNGNPGLVGEAGTPEIILPLNLPNIEQFMKAAGVTNSSTSSSLSYAPSYQISVSQDVGEGLGEKIVDILRDHDRELVNLIEEGKQNYFL